MIDFTWSRMKAQSDMRWRALHTRYPEERDYYRELSRDRATGKGIITIGCPFCGLLTRFWLVGAGKNCECGVKFNFFKAVQPLQPLKPKRYEEPPIDHSSNKMQPNRGARD